MSNATPWERAAAGPAPTAAEQAAWPREGAESDWRYAEMCAHHASGEPRDVFDRVYKARYVGGVLPPDPLTRRLCFVCVSCAKPCPEFYCTKCLGFVHGPAVAVPGRPLTFEEGCEAEMVTLPLDARAFLRARLPASCGTPGPEGAGFFCRACR